MSELSTTRRDVYSCLSICFDYPSELIIGVESVHTITKTLGSLARMCAEESLAGDARRFSRALREANNLLDLEVEYSRLFLGPFRPALYPSESIFLGRNSRESADVERADRVFLRESLALSSEFKDVPDHISVEFEFMSHLCCREIEAEESLDASAVFAYKLRQQSFLEKHIINWVPEFGERLEQATSNQFYKSLAAFTRQYVWWDYDRFEAPESEKELRLCHL
jgi:putative dimethyl sulfoxide reductase chaperone